MEIAFNYENFFDRTIYSSIAHAIFVLAHPFFDYEQSWDGLNYSYISDSSRGVVSFDPHNRIAVGAARNETGARMLQFANVPALRCFHGAPETVIGLADRETLEYLYVLVGRKKRRMITTACWLVNDTLCSHDSQEDFIKHGGEFLAEIMFADNLSDYWKEAYEWNNNEWEEADRLFRLFKSGQRQLKAEEILGWHQYPKGREACVTSLEEIGFQI